MDDSIAAMKEKVAELRATVESLPQAESPEQQAALDGLNELVRIFKGMSDSAEAFAERHNMTEHQ